TYLEIFISKLKEISQTEDFQEIGPKSIANCWKYFEVESEQSIYKVKIKNKDANIQYKLVSCDEQDIIDFPKK
ncbi:14517_t:CDS:2, partial [Gigaspora margarita]